MRAASGKPSKPPRKAPVLRTAQSRITGSLSKPESIGNSSRRSMAGRSAQSSDSGSTSGR